MTREEELAGEQHVSEVNGGHRRFTPLERFIAALETACCVLFVILALIWAFLGVFG